MVSSPNSILLCCSSIYPPCVCGLIMCLTLVLELKHPSFFSINHGFEIKRDTQFTPISQIHIAVIGWYSHEGLFS